MGISTNQGTLDEIMDIISNTFDTETCSVKYHVITESYYHKSINPQINEINNEIESISISKILIVPYINEIDEGTSYYYEISTCQIQSPENSVAENNIIFSECILSKVIADITSGVNPIDTSTITIDEDMIIKIMRYGLNLFNLSSSLGADKLLFIPQKGWSS